MESQLEVQYSQNELEQEFVGLRVFQVWVSRRKTTIISITSTMEEVGATGLKCFSSLGALSFWGRSTTGGLYCCPWISGATSGIHPPAIALLSWRVAPPLSVDSPG